MFPLAPWGIQQYVHANVRTSENLKITAYHVADTRKALHAVIAMKGAICTADQNRGSSSSPIGIPRILQEDTSELQGQSPSLAHRKVIGLQNLDNDPQRSDLINSSSNA
jgi:hypothetical protein